MIFYIGELGELVEIETIRDDYFEALRMGSTDCESFEQFLLNVTTCGGYYRPVQEVTVSTAAEFCAILQIDSLADIVDTDFFILDQSFFNGIAIGNSDYYHVILIHDKGGRV